MRRFRKRYKKPKVPFNAAQIQEGKRVKKGYGLRRKKEIWTAQETLRRFRQRARELIAVQNPESEQILLSKLVKIGVLEQGAGLDDVLGLTVENLLSRRLQSIVFNKGMVKTAMQARQAIVHGHVTIEGRKIIFPSYTVDREEETKIVCKFKPKEAPKPGRGVKKVEMPEDEEQVTEEVTETEKPTGEKSETKPIEEKGEDKPTGEKKGE